MLTRSIAFPLRYFQGVLVYWVTHNTFSVFQSLLLRLPAFKRFANIPDPPVRDPAAPNDAVGFRKAFNDTTEAFSEMYEGAVDRTNQKMEEKQAAKAKQQAKDEFEKKKKKAAELIKKAPTIDQAVNAQIVTDGAVESPEDAKRRRVAEARKRREQSRTRRTRI